MAILITIMLRSAPITPVAIPALPPAATALKLKESAATRARTSPHLVDLPLPSCFAKHVTRHHWMIGWVRQPLPLTPPGRDWQPESGITRKSGMHTTSDLITHALLISLRLPYREM